MVVVLLFIFFIFLFLLLVHRVAGQVIAQMNPNINIVAMQDRVSPLTENVFNDKFWRE